VHAFHEYLQDDLKNEEGFCIDVVLPFGSKVSNMTELRRREEDIPCVGKFSGQNAVNACH
jgi:hypothetical protein